MRQRLAKWMMGRNGMDALNRLLSVLTLILLIVSMFVHGYAARILWSLAVVGLIVIYFRMLSRNVYRRQQENGAYLRQKYKITSAWRGAVSPQKMVRPEHSSMAPVQPTRSISGRIRIFTHISLPVRHFPVQRLVT